ncbi:sulfurtransferase [Pseudonocardia sp. GCM10023141]|uniref:sulfurtransferase n=1 Tax=Pseudonocardia sp. GCM10023141 TaxID=3252653 RepID=UPI00361A4E7D
MAPLLSAPDLADALATPDPALRPVVLDVRHRIGGPPGRPDHDSAHLPGAVFLDLDLDLADPPGAGGRHPLPDPARLQEALRRAGISDDSLVVAHDDGNGLAAVRAWWVLRWAGLPAHHVAVLNGGFAGWVAAGLPTTAEPSRPAPGTVTVRPGSMPVADAEGAAELGRTGVLIDARAAARYRGETEPIDPVAGHVPGAHNVPVLDFAGADGRWPAPAELATRFAGLDIGGPDVGAYCGSGVTAAALVLGAEYAGLRAPEAPITLYAGSWSHWVTDPQRPVAVGDRP